MPLIRDQLSETDLISRLFPTICVPSFKVDVFFSSMSVYDAAVSPVAGVK